MNLLLLLIFTVLLKENVCDSSRTIRALQKDHEKPQIEKWMDAFFGRNLKFDQVPSLINLINVVTSKHLRECSPIILYDVTVEDSEGLLLEQLFRHYPLAYIHGQISTDYTIKDRKLLTTQDNTCICYIMFMADVRRVKDIIGEQRSTKIVIVARSSQWRVYEFLESAVARSLVNLLVIAQSDKAITVGQERPFILYTHKLYVDGLGSSKSVVLTSWIKGNFSLQNINLFPQKITEGFSGHRFVISIANQPPYTIKRESLTKDIIYWDGIEVRLINLLAEIYNFTTDFREAKDAMRYGSGDSVTKDVAEKKVDLGLAGVYVTPERFLEVDISQSHSQDCAAFITLASTALPRYRAIMGPFHWTVWLALTVVYLFAIFPLALSDKHTLKHLIKKPEEIENMFWYVFGTFTNCFTFSGEASWNQSDKITTRLLVGFYWIFTIITTACYTGSIIAFVTLPIFPETVDSTEELLRGRYQIGTLDKGGWQYWFENSTDYYTKMLYKNIEFLPTVESGLKNVTKAFFWPYAFLGSAAELDFISRTNFSIKSRSAILHISDECFVPYGISVLYTLNSVYKTILDTGLLHAMQTGFLIKIKNDVEWNIMRTDKGKFLQANAAGSTRLKVEDRALTLDDTQGMFLLLGFGFVLGGAALLSEWLGGCFNFCKSKMRRLSTTSIESNRRSHDTPTPREKLNSIQYSIHTRMCSIPDEQSIISSNVQEKETDVILHSNGDIKSIISNNSTDYDEEIDRIFKLDSLFGESNDEEEECIEEINEDECNVVLKKEN